MLDKNIKPKIIFDDSSVDYIIHLLGKEVKEGQIYEKNTDNKVKSFEGNDLTLENLGGVRKGSEVYIENSVVSLIRLKTKRE